MKRSLLASTVLVLCAGYARAQQVTVTNGESNTLNTAITTFGVSGIVNDDRLASVVSGTAIAVTGSGSITTTGNNAHGIYLDSEPASGSAALTGNTITGSGMISASGDYARGISLRTVSTGDGSTLVSANTITNSGLITTSGDISEGIHLRASSEDDASRITSNTITNTGTVNTSGERSTGIFLYSSSSSGSSRITSNTITSTGNVNTSGETSTGIYLRSFSSNGSSDITDNTITNTGSISTSAFIAYGILLEAGAGDDDADVTSNTISNSGTISTANPAAAGIYLRANSRTEANLTENIIVNSGKISTLDRNAAAIYLTVYSKYGDAEVGGNQITNTGTIVTKGNESNGIIISADDDSTSITGNTINNSGRLVSAYGDAVDIGSGTANTVTLTAPGFIGGRLEMGTSDTINLVSGASQSNLWSFTGTGTTFNTSGPLPWFSASDGTYTSYASFDPTGVAARGQMLADLAGLNSGFMQQGLGSLEQTSFDYRVWVTAGSNEQDYEGTDSTLEQDVSVSGGAIGAALRLKDSTILVSMLALNSATVTADSRYVTSQDNSTDGFAGGLFLRHIQGGFRLDAGLNLGWGKTSTKRFVNDNLADNGSVAGGTAATDDATLGNSTAKGDYEAWWFSPELGLSYAYALANRTSLTPSARLRYAVEAAPGYSEDVSTSRVADTDVSGAAEVGSYSTGVFEADLDLEAAKAFDWGRMGISAGYIIRQMTGDGEVEVSMVGQNHDVPVEATQFNAHYVAANLLWAATDRFDVTLDGRAVFSGNDAGLGIIASVGGTF
jgi:hypothetical protein